MTKESFYEERLLDTNIFLEILLEQERSEEDVVKDNPDNNKINFLLPSCQYFSNSKDKTNDSNDENESDMLKG